MMTGSYERIAEKLLKDNLRPKPYCHFENGKLLVGTQSLHRTAKARRWRTFWRLKYNRIGK